MKKADVKIGGEYYANVTNKKVVVRLDAENASGGWDATNLTTGKKVRIKSAQRLHGTPRQAKTEAEPAATESKPARAVKRVAKKEASAETPVKIKAAKKEAADKKLSCTGAALKILAESGQPMSTKEMIDAMVAAGYWESPAGKTPHATLYSAILRDMKRGEESRFVKAERGRFTVRA